MRADVERAMNGGAKEKRAYAVRRWGEKRVRRLEDLYISKAIEDHIAGKPRAIKLGDDTVCGVAYLEAWYAVGGV